MRACVRGVQVSTCLCVSNCIYTRSKTSRSQYLRYHFAQCGMWQKCTIFGYLEKKYTNMTAFWYTLPIREGTGARYVHPKPQYEPNAVMGP